MPASVVGMPGSMAPEPTAADREGIEATLASHGGRYRVRLRGQSGVLEGRWPSDDGLAILAFPSFEQVEA